jgi:hypothetical protein
VDGTDGAARSTCIAVAVAGAFVLLGLLNVPLGTPAPESRPTISEGSSAPSPRLAVDPDAWQMPAGNVATLTATWVVPAPNCTLSPYWFRWSVVGDSASGTVTPGAGAVVNFSATAVSTGRTTLVVRSAALMTCGPQSSAVFATAEANVTVVAPIVIQELSVGPNPVTPGGTAFLRGNLTGGESPYLLRVAWGDGTTSSVVLGVAGSFSIPHVFPEGDFSPSLEVTDSQGLLAHGSVGEPLTASDSLAVGIEASTYVTDVGTSVRFHVTVLDALTGYVMGWWCRSVTPARIASTTNSTNFSCSFSLPGPGEVFFEVLPPAPLSPAAVTLEESVVPVPTLGVQASSLAGEVGQPSLVAFHILGGVPPFVVDWAETGSALSGQLAVATDGTTLLPIVPTDAGSLELVARLVDADAFVTPNVAARLIVEPALNQSVVSGRASTISGEGIALTSALTAGAPPFEWVVVPVSPPSNETAPAGSLGSVGGFAWSGAYRTEGWTSVTVTVVDVAGGLSHVTITIETIPPMVGNLSVIEGNSSPPGSLALELSIAGGFPPFDITISASDGENWTHTVPSDGSQTWTLLVSGAGALGLQVAAVDAAGTELEWNATVDLPAPIPAPPSPSAPLSTLPEYGAGALLLLGASLSAVHFYRRRSRPAPPAPPDPVAVLRQIIEPADGADRATVELLAEEAGVPLGVVRSTIDRLIAEGTIRSDASVEDEEVLSWSAVVSP